MASLLIQYLAIYNNENLFNAISETSKKLPIWYKSCPKLISLSERKIFRPLQKLPSIEGDLGKIIVATGFEKLHKVQ